MLEVVEDDAGDTYRAIYTVIRLTSVRTHDRNFGGSGLEPLDAARSLAPAAAQAMPPAEVQMMTDRAADVAWTAPASQREYEVAKSRFVLPAEERQQQLEREAQRARQKEQVRGISS